MAGIKQYARSINKSLTPLTFAVLYTGPSPSILVEVTPPALSAMVTKMKFSHSSLNPIPTSLLKSCLSAISPIVTKIVNKSLRTGVMASSHKLSAITSLLKKTQS